MLRRILLALVVAGVALVAFGVISAVQDPLVARYEIAVPGLAVPLRVVQLSDSHASRVDMSPARLRRVAAMMNALKPDIIVLTGDYVSGNPDAWSPARTAAALAPLKTLRAPMGVYAVLGNHDDRYKTAAALATGPVRLLVGARVDLGPVSIVGVDDLTEGNAAVAGMREAVRGAPAGKPVVVLAHEPTFFSFLERRPVTMIVGHTHGGQIRLPILGSWVPDRYAGEHLRGIYRERGQVMLVSSGLGTSVVPLRIGVPPEIVEISLVPGQAGRNSGTER